MSMTTWAYILIAVSFGIYATVSWISHVRRAKGFYVADIGAPPVFTGMAMVSDRIGAASILSLAGVFFVAAPVGSAYVLGWVGGYFLLAVLFAPYLRRLLTFTMPDFVGNRYYSETARFVAVLCMLGICLIYLVGQIRGVGIVLSRLMGTGLTTGIAVSVLATFAYAAVSGTKGLVWTQVLQCVIVVTAYLLAAGAMSFQVTGIPLPQWGYLSLAVDTGAGKPVVETFSGLERVLQTVGVSLAAPETNSGMTNRISIVLALMFGTCAMPHIFTRYYTEPSVKASRSAVAYAIAFVALVYVTAPAVAALTRYNLTRMPEGQQTAASAAWIKSWEATGLIRQVGISPPREGQQSAKESRPDEPIAGGRSNRAPTGPAGADPEASRNIVQINPDIIVMASPEIAGLPGWIGGLLFAAALTAALAAATGLLVAVGALVSRDIYLRLINKKAPVRQQNVIAHVCMALAVSLAGCLAMDLRASIAQVVAWAFGIGAAAFFPALTLGVFWRRATTQGAIAGMVMGTVPTALYIVHLRVFGALPWLFGIGAEGIGAVGAAINMVTTVVVSLLTTAPPGEIQELVQRAHYPQDIFATRGRD